MSRLGKIPVEVVKGAKVTINKTEVLVEGTKGKLSLPIPRGIAVEQQGDELIISRSNDTKQNRANHGTVRAHLRNMIQGVTDGHAKNLEIIGVGFRAQVQGSKLNLTLGFSHPVDYEVPKDVKVSSGKPTEIRIEGADITRVGQVAAEIRALKRPEPYKGKGIRYAGEVVRRKQGKSVTK